MHAAAAVSDKINHKFIVASYSRESWFAQLWLIKLPAATVPL